MKRLSNSFSSYQKKDLNVRYLLKQSYFENAVDIVKEMEEEEEEEKRE